MAYALGQLIKRVAMRIMLAVLLLLGCQVSAGEWVGTKGGLSEDGKLAVVVYSQKTAFIEALGVAQRRMCIVRGRATVGF
jgi:hypothetical protein